MKGTYLTSWEDEENNRHVQFSVEYAIENGMVNLDSVTPQKVSFICPTSNTRLGSVGVWTEKGRSMLAGQFHASGKVETLKNEILNRNEVPATV